MLIPDKIDKAASKGERNVFYRFKKDPACEEYYILHSLFISKHLRKISGEIDFLVLAPGKGIFALEVKHGGISRRNGRWYHTDRFGKETETNKNPFKQVNDNLFSLQNLLLKILDKEPALKKRVKKLMLGWGVMFTSMDEFYETGIECESWQLYTRSSSRVPISEYIDALSVGYKRKYENQGWFDPNRSIPSKKDCELIYTILRGDFNYDYASINKVLDDEYLIDAYTKEQFNLLDLTSYNQRCWVEGGAGTGKTLMAQELWMRKAKEGHKTALFCYNNALGEKLNKNAQILAPNDTNGSFAGTFDAFMMKKTALPVAEDAKQFFEETLPWEFLFQSEEIPEKEKFDSLILDEAQDIIKDINLDILDNILKGGLANGSWTFFGDYCNQCIYQENANLMANLLTSKASCSKLKLQVNCRNAQKIAKKNTLLTGYKSTSNYNMPNGGAWEHFLPDEEILPKVESIIKEIIEKSIPLEKVTLLSNRQFEKSNLFNSNYIKKKLEKTALSFSTIHGFKGLENSIVILTDLNSLIEPNIQKLLYIGVSRARLELYLVLPEKLEAEFDKLIQENFKLIS